MDLFNAVVLFDTGFLSLVPYGIRGWLERSREATPYGMAHIQCTVRFPYLPTLRSYLQLLFFFFPDETRVFAASPTLLFVQVPWHAYGSKRDGGVHRCAAIERPFS